MPPVSVRPIIPISLAPPRNLGPCAMPQPPVTRRYSGCLLDERAPRRRCFAFAQHDKWANKPPRSYALFEGQRVAWTPLGGVRGSSPGRGPDERECCPGRDGLLNSARVVLAAPGNSRRPEGLMLQCVQQKLWSSRTGD